MANLDLIRKLNAQYGKRSAIGDKPKLSNLNEAFDPGKIEKALPSHLANMGPSYTAYFDFGLSTEVALLYIDVCGFSTHFGHLDGEGIADYFDEYYDIIIPIIYKNGGEIDKVMGDGIICVFGPPFLNDDLEENIDKANTCAKNIISKTRNSIYSSKIAFHCGEINYFKNKTGLYNEFTMIGKPLTELFRLESVSHEECVNYYVGTRISQYYGKRISTSLLADSKMDTVRWRHGNHSLPKLKGIDFTTFNSIKYTSGL